MVFKKIRIAMLGVALLMTAPMMKIEAHAEESVGIYNDLTSDDTTLMQKAHWSNGGVFDCVFAEENVAFEDGIMTLKLDKNTNAKYDYIYSGAEYRSLSTCGYGMYRVKMKPIKNDGVVSSFFTYTGPAHGTIWDEIDIEFLGKDTTKVQFNFFANGKGGHECIYELGFDAAEEWHEYGFLWEEDAITWFVDGKEAYKVTSEESEIPYTPSQIMMNVWNGRTDMSDIKAWLNEYDGTVGLTASYDYFRYTPIAEYKANTEVPETEEPSVEKEVVTEEIVKEVSKTVELKVEKEKENDEKYVAVIQMSTNRIGMNEKLAYTLTALNNSKNVFRNMRLVGESLNAISKYVVSEITYMIK